MSTLTTFVISMVEPILFYSSSFSVSHVQTLKKLPTIHPLTNRLFCKHHVNTKSADKNRPCNREKSADVCWPIISADFYLSCVMGLTLRPYTSPTDQLLPFNICCKHNALYYGHFMQQSTHIHKLRCRKQCSTCSMTA